jgi:hypothetical protein
MKLYLLFSLIVIGLIYFAGMAGGIGEAVCTNANTGDKVSGFELFFFCNLNIFIFIAWIVSIVAVVSL